MFTFTDLSVECEGNVFMPVQALNKMRRDVLEKLKEEILSGYRRNSSVPPTKEEQEAIAGILYDMDCDIHKLEEKLSKYQKVKQGMMEELLTGKVRLV